MKSIITLVALVIMASPSFAATKKPAAKATKTTTSENTTHSAAATDNATTYTSHHSTKEGINWQAGLGLGSISTVFAFGARVQGMIPVAHMAEGDILVGGESGFLYGPSTPSVWGIPIMAAGVFNFKGNGKITPYAGLSMGVGIWHYDTGGSATVSGVTISYAGSSGTSAYFAMLARGGLYFGEDQKLFAELPLGTMGSAFAILPTFGMKF